MKKTHLSPTTDISLRLDQYSDIYSDFDVRPYASRALSVDFIDEIKRAALDKSVGGVTLELYVPDKTRNEADEATIRDRLIGHFTKHHVLLVEERRQMVRMGVVMIALGIVCMLGAAVILFNDHLQHFLWSLLLVFLEPAAWFLLWEGMDLVIFTPRSIRSDLQFYRKMAAAGGRIRFKPYSARRV